MVQVAIQALSNFGALNRKQAKNLLLMWAHTHQLSTSEIREVLRAFP
jgi:hypothetical protein